jgi:hypothetical protein
MACRPPSQGVPARFRRWYIGHYLKLTTHISLLRKSASGNLERLGLDLHLSHVSDGNLIKYSEDFLVVLSSRLA